MAAAAGIRLTNAQTNDIPPRNNNNTLATLNDCSTGKSLSKYNIPANAATIRVIKPIDTKAVGAVPAVKLKIAIDALIDRSNTDMEAAAASAFCTGN